MKTNREIHAEALQLSTIGQRFAGEARGTVAAPQRMLARVTETGLNFPSDENWLATNVRLSGLGRYIDVVVMRDELVFRLLEVDSEKRSPDFSFNADDALIVRSSDSPFDVLHAGYARIEQERLSEQLAAYGEPDSVRTEPDREAADDVEAILEVDQLPAADRMRTRAEVAEFLSGRLEAHDLITRAIERQAAREGQRETIAVRNEIRITIDEP